MNIAIIIFSGQHISLNKRSETINKLLLRGLNIENLKQIPSKKKNCMKKASICTKKASICTIYDGNNVTLLRLNQYFKLKKR